MRASVKGFAAGCSVVVAATSVFAGGPVSAAATTTKCGSTQKREFDTTGANTTVFLKPCVQKSGGQSRAYIAGQWYALAYTGKRFDKLTVKTRLEYLDSVFRSKTCDWTAKFNAARGGAGEATCYTSWAGGGGYTSDGYAVVNVDLDGDGDWTWQLTGSPSL